MVREMTDVEYLRQTITLINQLEVYPTTRQCNKHFCWDIDAGETYIFIDFIRRYNVAFEGKLGVLPDSVHRTLSAFFQNSRCFHIR